MADSDHNTRIIIVEDDVNLGFLLVEFLESNGFEVKLYRDGLSALNGFRISGFDFCIIDLMLPGMDGFTLTGEIKEMNRDIPVIILSARSLKEDKINGFRLGVDDYITKPFDEEELLYRIRAILNRLKNGKNQPSSESQTLMIGNYRFDPLNQVLSFGKNSQRITVKESRILLKLAVAMNNVVTRDEIMLNVWGESDYYTGRSLDVFISKIRGYLKKDPSVQIVTIPTVGYLLEVK
ncbi:MAG TPA: response regulator transcription factor [Bacteroidales bacterium]|nr:response regulator transcription factor [Bacteroidales bacterium]